MARLLYLWNGTPATAEYDWAFERFGRLEKFLAPVRNRTVVVILTVLSKLLGGSRFLCNFGICLSYWHGVTSLKIIMLLATNYVLAS
jgi:hypothetical protein